MPEEPSKISNSDYLILVEGLGKDEKRSGRIRATRGLLDLCLSITFTDLDEYTLPIVTLLKGRLGVDQPTIVRIREMLVNLGVLTHPQPKFFVLNEAGKDKASILQEEMIQLESGETDDQRVKGGVLERLKNTKWELRDGIILALKLILNGEWDNKISKKALAIKLGNIAETRLKKITDYLVCLGVFAEGKKVVVDEVVKTGAKTVLESLGEEEKRPEDCI